MASSPKEAANNRSVRITDPYATIRFLLRAWRYTIGPPPEVYDYDTGKLIGRILNAYNKTGPKTKRAAQRGGFLDKISNPA